MLPRLIEAGWFEPGAAAYLGAANLAGYFAGALMARGLARRAPPAQILRTMMVLASLSFFACAGTWPFAWFFLWRFLAGVSGAVLMVIGPSFAMQIASPDKRGLVGGLILTGVGAGMVASGTLVSQALAHGGTATWLMLGAAATLRTGGAWRGWRKDPSADAGQAPSPPKDSPGQALGLLDRPVLALFAVYCLTALGLVPHMVFLVDYAARGLALGIGAGSALWIWFGLGAMGGPVLAGRLGDLYGFRRTLLVGTAFEVVAVATTAFTESALLLSATSLVVGAYVPASTTLVLGRLDELTKSDLTARIRLWGIGTTAFSLGQAAGAYALAYYFSQGASYPALFAAGAASLGVAFGIDLAWGERRPPSRA